MGSSTRIEGSRLTDRQVEDLLGRLNITEFRTPDEQEVAGYAYVMDQVFDAFEQIPFTENMIGQLHQDLLRYSTKDERHRGHPQRPRPRSALCEGVGTSKRSPGLQSVFNPTPARTEVLDYISKRHFAHQLPHLLRNPLRLALQPGDLRLVLL